MSTRTTVILSTLLIALATLAGFSLLPRLPEQMASHWNQYDVVDGTMPRIWGVALLPLVSLGMVVLFMIIPKIDPLKENVASFRGMFNSFILLLILFMVYVYALTLIYNLGWVFPMSVAMLPALGILIFTCGVLIERAKRNWFIGIRTPWTLSSDVVWEKTHRLGGNLFKLAALMVIPAMLFPSASFWLFILPLMAVALITMVYSYLVYQQEKTKAI